MPPVPKLGLSYTRAQINEMVGGGVQAILPMRGSRVVCGCFRLDTNPDAPKEVLVAPGPKREMSAKAAVVQQMPIPIFLKEEAGEWKYIGNYKPRRYLHREHALLAEEPRAKREDVAGILYLDPIE
jgi:hypothetical protein